MNTQINDGGSAFPIPYGQIMSEEGKGMSLRDWLAGQEKIDPSEEFNWELLEALAGPRPDGDWKSNPLGWFEWSNTWQAAARYARADAMIKVRNQIEQ